MSETLEKNSVIGERFLIYDVIEGGYGIVYLCLDTDPNNLNFVALKTLKDSFMVREDFRTDFERSSIQSIHLGKHPNIVFCLDYDEYDGRKYLVMEFVAGDPDRGVELSDWLEDGALKPQLALSFAIDILQGMIHAKKHNIIAHRDLKPDNILITVERVAKITDFGIAHVKDSNSTRGRGTTYYMSPEQWQNQTIDERSDIYAIGLILFEMLTGKRLYNSESASELREAHLSGVQDWAVYPELPAYLIEVLAKACDPDKAQRYDNFEALRDELGAIYRQEFSDEPRMLSEESADYKIDDYIRRAHLYYRIGHYKEAIEDFSHALRLDLDAPLLLASRAVAYTQLEQNEDALKDIKRALVIERDNPRVQFLAALCYRFLGDYEQALGYAQEVVALEPNNTAARMNAIICMYHLNQYTEMVAELTRLIIAGEDKHSVYFYRGLAYRELKRYEDAVRDFTRQLQQDSTEAMTYVQRAQIYDFYLERYKDALHDYDQAISLEETKPEHYINRGRLYRKLNLFYEALKDAEKALELGSTSSAPYKEQGHIYFRMREYEKSLENFSKAIEIDATDVESISYRGRVYEKLKRNDEALTDFNRAIELDPKNIYILRARATFYMEAKNYALAMYDVVMALQISPQDIGLNFTYGVILFQQERYNEASSAFMMVLGYRSNYAEAHGNLATCYMYQEREQQAEYHYIMALQLNPSLLKVRLNLGILKEHQGNPIAALEHYILVAQLGDPAGLEMMKNLASQYPINVVMLDPINLMREAIFEATSLEAMRIVVRRFPFMLDDEFDALLPKMFDEEERIQLQLSRGIYWLRLAVAEQRS